ncbi:hypothetical protein QYF61_023738 [Mycteria americana]|uniref:Uncharacterized protein n=1 Tax=Mycteria americana TaxID=33587 RepID=A0AAN7RLF1_MYCAM|nr:hypothetical protein QYF61_023738 [Mycteria americana]
MATQARELSSSPSPQHWCSHIWTSVSRCGAPESGGMRRNWRGSRGDLPGWGLGPLVLSKIRELFLVVGREGNLHKVQLGRFRVDARKKKPHSKSILVDIFYQFQFREEDMELVEVSCERGETTVALIFEYGQKCNPGNHRLYSLAWVIH